MANMTLPYRLFWQMKKLCIPSFSISWIMPSSMLPRATFWFIAKPDGQMVCIQVQDFGPGISDDAIPIFLTDFIAEI